MQVEELQQSDKFLEKKKMSFRPEGEIHTAYWLHVEDFSLRSKRHGEGNILLMMVVTIRAMGVAVR